MRDVLAGLSAALDSHAPCVFCQVVETRGSTPQKAGAAMLVWPDGTQRGTLGGGCVEAEVKRHALHALNTHAPDQLFTFHLDDDYGWDDGLICGGRMTVLVAPFSCKTQNHEAVCRYYRLLRDLTEEGQGFTEAVILSESAGFPSSRYLFDHFGRLIVGLPQAERGERVHSGLADLSHRPQPYVRQGIAYLPSLPRITLLIVGGGHVGQAVARLAAELDFDIWVLDDREKYVSADRFPIAQRRLVGDIGRILADVAPTLTPNVYALIVTRGHNHDEEALYHLARTRCGYVGMIGSKRKIRLIFEDLLAKDVPSELLARVHAPLGFNIGSQTVPEIAVSIVAELIAHRNLGSTAISRLSWQSEG